jgi:hypothetical protein
MSSTPDYSSNFGKISDICTSMTFSIGGSAISHCVRGKDMNGNSALVSATQVRGSQVTKNETGNDK